MRWHINITVTILDIIHRPVFYRERESGGGGSERHYNSGEGRKQYFLFEGSQALPASPSARGET
jgi:hypothetical protein